MYCGEVADELVDVYHVKFYQGNVALLRFYWELTGGFQDFMSNLYDLWF